MATSDLALGAKIDHMNVATPGKDAPDPNKIPPKRALFSSPPVAAHNKTNEHTPSTAEKRHLRESHLVILRGDCITNTSEQRVANINKAIDAETSLEQLLKSRIEMVAQAMVKITSEPLDGFKHKDLVLLKEGLQNTQAMLVMPKSACIGALASPIAGYFDAYRRIYGLMQGRERCWALVGLPWMKKMAELFGTGTDGEFDMTFERNLDRHKDKLKYCTDAMALGFSSWAVPHVINALISALRFEFVSEATDPEDLYNKQYQEFKMVTQETLKALGVQGPERDDGWVVYPESETVEITAKGLDMLRLPVGTKMEMKRLVTTDELQAVIDVYVSPQSGIFNIKRGFREGGDGFEAVIAELGDDVLMIMPRIEMDTEATGLIKLSLRVKLTSEKEIEKKLQALCKDSRNDTAENKGIPTKLASGVEVRIVWSGDLGTARVRNGLTRAAAISAELSGKNSEEAKKLRSDLEKQIKANADALLEQDAKLTSYTAHYTMLIDKQAAVVTEMQGKHMEAMTDMHKQMLANEDAHAKMLQDSEQARKDSETSAAFAMDGLRQQIAELQNLQIRAQQNMLTFAARADEMAAALTGHVKRSECFMEAVKIEMLAQKQEVQLIKDTAGSGGE